MGRAGYKEKIKYMEDSELSVIDNRLGDNNGHKRDNEVLGDNIVVDSTLEANRKNSFSRNNRDKDTMKGRVEKKSKNRIRKRKIIYFKSNFIYEIAVCSACRKDISKDKFILVTTFRDQFVSRIPQVVKMKNFSLVQRPHLLDPPEYGLMNCTTDHDILNTYQNVG